LPKFLEMEGIVGELGEMKIPLKLEAKPIKKRPYRINPRYKEKVKVEIDRMLEVGIIKPIVDYKWICQMVVHDKKSGEITICVDLRKLMMLS